MFVNIEEMFGYIRKNVRQSQRNVRFGFQKTFNYRYIFESLIYKRIVMYIKRINKEKKYHCILLEIGRVFVRFL